MKNVTLAITGFGSLFIVFALGLGAGIFVGESRGDSSHYYDAEFYKKRFYELTETVESMQSHNELCQEELTILRALVAGDDHE